MRAGSAGRKKHVKGILVMAFTFVFAVCGSAVMFPEQVVYAQPDTYQTIGNNVHLDQRAMYPFRQMKTLDLSESDIEITLTEAQKTALKKQARDEVEGDLNAVKNYLVKKGWMNQDGTYKEGAEPNDDLIEAFLEDRADGDVQRYNELRQVKRFLLEGMGYVFDGTEWNYAAWWDYVWVDDADKFSTQWNAYLKNNSAEKFNELQSQALVKQMREKLQVKFDFDLVALEDSEKEAYGVDGEKVLAGKLKGGKKSVSFSEVDFGARNQFYDEIMEYMADNLQGEYGEEYDNGKQMVGTWGLDSDTPEVNASIEKMYKAFADKFGLDYRVEVRYNRNYIELMSFPEQHIWTRDSGRLWSSDDSQTSWNVPMDDTEWPGWHYLLEVGDSLSTYNVLRPCWTYSRTFNLHLNPAVNYFFDVGEEVDFVTDVKTDSNGRVTSISKPLHMNADLKALNNKVDGDEDHIYRFKLVESSASPKSLGNNDFVENKEVKICDVQLDEYQGARVWIFDDMQGVADTVQAAQGRSIYGEDWHSPAFALVSHATFTNKLVKKKNADSVTDDSNVNGKTQGEGDKDGKNKVDVVDDDADGTGASAGTKTSGVRTGDYTSLGLWIVLAGVSLMGVLVLVVRRRRA